MVTKFDVVHLKRVRFCYVTMTQLREAQLRENPIARTLDVSASFLYCAATTWPIVTIFGRIHLYNMANHSVKSETSIHYGKMTES